MSLFGRSRSAAAKKWQKFREQALYVLLSPYRFFKFLCFMVGLQVMLVALFLGIYAYTIVRSLPDLAHMDYASLRSLGQRKVTERLENKQAFRRWVDIDSINRGYLYAVVMSEDSNFFEHNGFNMDAMIDSLAENIKERKASYGASTISQQVVKNLFLTNEKTVVRKLKEILITRDLEAHFKKNQILELYLNIAELGPDIYGVEAAARHYFDKGSDEINAAEGAFIALMLPSPKRHHFIIFENKNLTKQKRRKIHRVLNDMLYHEYITDKQYREYRNYDYFGTRKKNRRGLAGKKKRR